MRVMYKWAEASAPARGDDHMSSDVVQSVLHLSSACAGKAHTPQLRAAGQTTGVGPGITDVLGVRQRVQEARAPCWSSASALLRPLAVCLSLRWYLEKLNSGLKSDIRCDMRLIAQDRSQQHGIRLISA